MQPRTDVCSALAPPGQAILVVTFVITSPYLTCVAVSVAGLFSVLLARQVEVGGLKHGLVAGASY